MLFRSAVLADPTPENLAALNEIVQALAHTSSIAGQAAGAAAALQNDQLTQGVSSLSTGLAGLSDNSKHLKDGASQLSDGLSQLSDASSKLPFRPRAEQPTAARLAGCARCLRNRQL